MCLCSTASLDVVLGDVCVPLMCIHVHIPEREVEGESVLGGAWLISANIFQIFLYASAAYFFIGSVFS